MKKLQLQQQVVTVKCKKNSYICLLCTGRTNSHGTVANLGISNDKTAAFPEC